MKVAFLSWARGLAVAALLGVTASAGLAQQYPSKPLRIIVPFAPGGLLDALMRRMGASISTSVGQPVVIDNKPGGLTNIGMQACATAKPDGYTVCFTLEDSTIYNPLLFSKMPYDASALVPVVHLASAQTMLVASANAPFGNYKEMVAYARANPGKVNFGTWGPGSGPDLYRQWIGRAAGVDTVAVPYKGVGSGTMQALMGGEIHVTVFTVGQTLPLLQGGKVKPIAITGDKRFAGLPAVGTLAEEGADPGLTSVWGVYAPPGTPRAAVETLNAEFRKALATPEVREMLQTNTLDPVGGSAAEFAKFLDSLRATAQRVFRTLNIKPTDQPS